MLACLAGWPTFASAAETDEQQPPRESRGVAAGLRFAGGAVLAFAAHETGHLTIDVTLGTDPYLKKVDFGGIPFFAVTYRRAVPPRETYAIASAGFWVQQGLSEWLLTRTPDLRHRGMPTAKGVLAFHVASSLAYAGAAFAHAGPLERDTLGMAKAQRVDERWVGALILAPAALDTYRYLRPRSPWAPWASRGLKLATVLLVVR